MVKKVSRRMLVNDIKKLMQRNSSMSKSYLELLEEITLNPEDIDFTEESRIIQCAYVMLTGNAIELKRAIKKYQKCFPND
ncbi:MAG: hypothetical protein J6J60_06710 [Clostridia bacterium]|nr:hypothetical protein [Clostridia bacterium]